jgi:hypothetical protein
LLPIPSPPPRNTHLFLSSLEEAKALRLSLWPLLCALIAVLVENTALVRAIFAQAPPSFLLLVAFSFWYRQPLALPLVALFSLGLVQGVLEGAPLGLHALLWVCLGWWRTALLAVPPAMFNAFWRRAALGIALYYAGLSIAVPASLDVFSQRAALTILLLPAAITVIERKTRPLSI